MNRNYSLFAQDIFDCIQSIEDFTNGQDFDEFNQDDKTKSAVVRKLEIMGEAAKQVPEYIQKFESLPWSEMARMRDKLIHAYFEVDYEIVWQVIKEELPKLKEGLKKTIERIKKEEKDH